MSATRSTHLIFHDLITLIVFGEEHRSWSSTLRNFLKSLATWDPRISYTLRKIPKEGISHLPRDGSPESPLLTSFLLRPNAFLSTLFSNSLSLCCSLNVRDQRPNPYKINKIIFFLCFPSRSVVTYKHNVSVNNTTLYFIYNKNSILPGDMFRPLLGHLQALWENRSKNFPYLNALSDPRYLQIVLLGCEIRKFVYIGICVAVSALKG